MIADIVGADALGQRLMICGRAVINRACPACGGMYLVAEPIMDGERSIGMVVRCSMPGCRQVVASEYSEEYRRELDEEEDRLEAERRAWADDANARWEHRREYA